MRKIRSSLFLAMFIICSAGCSESNTDTADKTAGERKPGLQKKVYFQRLFNTGTPIIPAASRLLMGITSPG